MRDILLADKILVEVLVVVDAVVCRNLDLSVRTRNEVHVFAWSRATLNSLMNEETFLFEITSHSHSLTPITESGTLIFMSDFTLHWHPRRQLSFICLRVKWGFSESRISPPPSSTCTLHCPQLALPPHAEAGRCRSR